ncbi:Isopentenyl phosphate kinase [Linum grandiflorum]
MEKPSNSHNLPTIRCIVKLGGAAITCKNELEKINEENLGIVSTQLRKSMASSGSESHKILGMDWSKRPGKYEVCCDLDEFEDQSTTSLDPANFVVVHGAGSFGHFQASKSGVHRGGLEKPVVKAGFVATRISVTTLNLEIVRALAAAGIPSVGMSPFSCGWSTSERNLTSADLSMVAKAIDSGFVPVLHGDAVLDKKLVNVFGVYDRPPSEPDAVLLREIAVTEEGSWSVVKPSLENANKPVEMTVAAHDTTGGMATKIAEAAMIAKLGIDVYIVKAATCHSRKALSGEIRRGSIPDDWLGTVIKYVGKQIPH